MRPPDAPVASPDQENFLYAGSNAERDNAVRLRHFILFNDLLQTADNLSRSVCKAWPAGPAAQSEKYGILFGRVSASEPKLWQDTLR